MRCKMFNLSLVSRYGLAWAPTFSLDEPSRLDPAKFWPNEHNQVRMSETVYIFIKLFRVPHENMFHFIIVASIQLGK